MYTYYDSCMMTHYVLLCVPVEVHCIGGFMDGIPCALVPMVISGTAIKFNSLSSYFYL